MSEFVFSLLTPGHEPWRQRRSCCGDGSISGHLSWDRIKSVLSLGIFARVTFIPAALLIGFWFLMQLVNLGAVASVADMGKTGGVAYLAHVGGLIFVAVSARLFEGWATE